MDPLTHTLVGANLSSTRLGQTTRFATAALVVGANLPDIDGVCYAIDSDLALWFRRGWTHGVLSLVVLPLLLALLLLAIDRWRPRSDSRVDFRWMLALSSIAVWSHPTLDWLNTYGMRWLMPFDGRWFYGDAVFIMDIWLWLVLGVGYLAGKKPSVWIILPGLLIGAWIVRAVARRSPEYLPLILGIALVFVAALFWRGASKRPEIVQRFATAGLLLMLVYTAVRLAFNEATEAAVVRDFARRGEVVTQLMAAPHPISPLKWTVVARVGDYYRHGTFDWSDRALALEAVKVLAARDSEEWRRAKRDPSVRGLVNWLRFPAYEVEKRGEQTLVHIWDARRSGAGRRATVVLE